jgi:Fe-S cluster assembly protein SufD
MIEQQKSESEVFHQFLTAQFNEISHSDVMQKIRNKAWDHYLELGLPSRKSEAFNYIKFSHLFNQSFSSPKVCSVTEQEIDACLYPECKNSALVFINGFFQPSLSRLSALPARLVILSLAEALKSYGTFITNYWAKSLQEETDPFASLNAALHSNGCFVYLPPKTVIETPIQILNLVKVDAEPMLILPRLHLFAGAQSQANLYVKQCYFGEQKSFINMAVEMSIEEDAHITYTQDSRFNLNSVWHFDALRAILKRNSTLKTIHMTNGSASVRHDYRVALAGENAEALLNGVWMLESQREAHAHVLIDHQAPNCRSMQLFKGVLNDISQSSFEGKIYVRQAAQKTEAFQLNHNLLLSDKASAHSKPNLEIFADDVKASHGATVGQLEDEQLFYMISRGLEKKTAKNLLIQGFCKDVLNQISLPSLVDECAQFTQSYMNKS